MSKKEIAMAILASVFYIGVSAAVAFTIPREAAGAVVELPCECDSCVGDF